MHAALCPSDVMQIPLHTDASLTHHLMHRDNDLHTVRPSNLASALLGPKHLPQDTWPCYVKCMFASQCACRAQGMQGHELSQLAYGHAAAEQSHLGVVCV